ncbi:MAG: Globin-coupled histidine kinase [Calditrichaeota bacterium]|nr:Globin-coupled histidine kinase [Calditrichota bacterium]
MSFRSRLFFSFLVLAMLIVAGSVLTVNSQFAQVVREDVFDELARSPERFATFQASQMDNLITQAANIATSPVLRGSMSTGDRPTAAQAADETNVLYGFDLFWVLDVRGTVLHRVEEPHAWGDRIDHLPAVQDARNGYDSGDIWLRNGILYQVAATPIRSGDQWLGILIIGERFDSGIAPAFTKLSHLFVAFAPEDTVRFSSHDGIRGFPLKRVFARELDNVRGRGGEIPSVPWWRTGPDTRMPDSPTFEFEAADANFAGALFALEDAQNQRLAYAMVFQSLGDVRALQGRIRGGLIIVGVVAMFLALLVAYLLARGLTQPIQRLVTASQRLGREDLETPVPVRRGDEIGKLAAALDEMRVTLRDARAEALRNERLSTIGRMASTITHDFRQPITSIYGYIQLITLPSADRETQEEFAQRIIQQIDRMQGMINELLDYSRGEYVLRPKDVRLSDFLDTVRENFALVSRDQQIDISLDLGWDGIVRLDRERFERVLDNLVRNAVQAIGSDGHVTLRTSRNENRIELQVSDDGPGISQEVRRDLFDAFVTHGKSGGTGLGLAVAKRVVEEHGGTISVESEPGEGTTFTIRIPSELPLEA